MKKKKNDEDIFLEFIIKEKELAETEKIHAQVIIKYMSDNLKEKESHYTIFNIIYNEIKDFFVGLKLKYIKYKNDCSIKDITEKDKKDKIIKHKICKHGDFKVYYMLLRTFRNKTLIDDCGGIDISNFEYQSYIRIEYNDLISTKQLLNIFKKEKDAIEYYNKLISDNKNKNIYSLLKDITDLMNSKCDELNKRIEKFNNF